MNNQHFFPSLLKKLNLHFELVNHWPKHFIYQRPCLNGLITKLRKFNLNTNKLVISWFWLKILSMPCRYNLTLICWVCKAVLRSLFWIPNRLNKLVWFEFLSSLIGLSNNTFSNRPIMCVVKPWYTAGGPEEGFWHWVACRWTYQRFSFIYVPVMQAKVIIDEMTNLSTRW